MENHPEPPIRQILEPDASSWIIDSPPSPVSPESLKTPDSILKEPVSAEKLRERSNKSIRDRFRMVESSLSLHDTKDTNGRPMPFFFRPVETQLYSGNLGGDDIIFMDPNKYSNVEIAEDPAESSSFETNSVDLPFLSQVKLPLFSDGTRTIDFVLVWELRDSRACTEESFNKRRIFELNLTREGFQLEYEQPRQNGMTFIKLHATLEVLRRYCEILKIRMQMKKIPGLQTRQRFPSTIMIQKHKWYHKFFKLFLSGNIIFPPINQKFTAVYSRDREYLFDVNSPDFFCPATRARIIKFILDRKFFTENHDNLNAFGIARLINDRVYTAAYPLHDGDLVTPPSWRYSLYKEWAEIKNMFRSQPLDPIREYFGIRIAIYFTWLQFYTLMLIPASLVGILCFIYGCVTVYSDTPSDEICNAKEDVKMCPRCDNLCYFSTLKDYCLFSKLTYLFDNPSTVFFATFMSCWAAIFLELWKRYSAEITHRWDLTSYDNQEEHPRPQYLARLSKVKEFQMNTVTHTWEPKVSFWRYRLPARIFTFSLFIILVSLVLATVFGVILYRMSTFAALSIYTSGKSTNYAIMFVAFTGATINLLCILAFNAIYSLLAVYLTEIEYLRTDTEFDESVTVKIYMLQFVNYYASLFYVAFFKGAFVGHPGSYNRLFSYRLEECNPAGCLCELSIQLFIIMIGKQLWTTLMEMVIPLLYNLYNSMKLRSGMPNSNKLHRAPQWVRDFKLLTWRNSDLHREYLEMVIQYGFVTIFVAAFPIAPFCALINNIFEIRMDAQKLLIFYRRPVSGRVRDIGIWFRILHLIGRFSIISNALIIAFTSSFIPKLVYLLSMSPDNSLAGYLNFSLVDYDTSVLHPTRPSNVSRCRFPAFRELPASSSFKSWHLLTARLAFVLVFQNTVAFLITVCQWVIPDVSSELRDIIRREAFITNEIIIKQEALRTMGFNPPDNIVLQKERHSPPSSPVSFSSRMKFFFTGRSLASISFNWLWHIPIY